MARGPISPVTPVLIGDDLPADVVRRGPESPYNATVLAAMADQPGSWFHLSTFSKRQSATGRMNALNEKHGEDGYEFQVRTTEDGNTLLYGRKTGSKRKAA